ncbi:MAG: chemotaxis protein CheX [Lachnospiraceae bacterium]
MHTQFFGNYLLTNHAITTQQFLEAAEILRLERLKIGNLAMHAGYMTPEEVNNVVIMQTRTNLRFGEIAVLEGYLTEQQLNALLDMQIPDYMLFGQILVDQGALSSLSFKQLLYDYQKNTTIDKTSLVDQNKEMFIELMQICLQKANKAGSEAEFPKELFNYLNLLFNNLLRFIGEDFTMLKPYLCTEYKTDYCVSQSITGSYEITSYFDISKETAVEFASRYTGDRYKSFDEYAKASLEDFLNLHNGLYNVNVSNESSVELVLSPTVIYENELLNVNSCSFLLPVIYPFGKLHFIFHLDHFI